jgi:hypothetical protein
VAMRLNFKELNVNETDFPAKPYTG